MKKTIRACAVGMSLAAAAIPAAALETDFSFKLKAAGLWEGPRDLGLLGRDETTEAYLDVQPALHLQFSPNFASYVRVQGFAPTGRVVQRENTEPVRTKAYGQLRELWLEFGGITTYPGEVLRLGLQRVRDPDGLWYDRDIESVRWIFDTTLLQAQLGVAQQFETYRTDNNDLPGSQKDRAYAFAGISGQWLPRNYAGVRVAYAGDHGDAPAAGATLQPDDKLEDRRYTWAGVHFHNGYYALESDNWFAYWAEVVGLFGSQEDVVLDPLTGTPTGATTADDVRAYGGDAGARVRVSQSFPLQIGAHYALGQGGRKGGDSRTFRQTGLQSNRSRFTGTRSIIHRFNEALDADLQNLSVITAYLSLPIGRWDASLVGHRFRRDDSEENISVSGIDVDPLTGPGASNDIGDAADLIVTCYFDRRGNEHTPGEDVRDNVRLRGSAFRPGDAYGSGLDDQFKVTLETTLWF